MNKAASQYLREVKKRIHCSHPRKTEFLCQLEGEINYYCEDHGDVEYLTLLDHFGKPEDIAQDFLSELGESVVIRSKSIKYRVLFLAGIFLIFASILVSIVELYTSYKQQQALDISYVESITQEGELHNKPAVWILTESNGKDVFWEINEKDNLWIEETKPSYFITKGSELYDY